MKKCSRCGLKTAELMRSSKGRVCLHTFACEQRQIDNLFLSYVYEERVVGSALGRLDGLLLKLHG